MSALVYQRAARRRARPRACWSSTTAAAPTSTTCSASPTCSTRSGGCTSSRRGGPLQVPGWPGKHWYVVPRVGFPDHDTFHAAYASSPASTTRLWERTGTTPENTVFGGFSMGSVMSYSLGLGPDRPAPAGILAFCGFIPTVDGWQPDARARTRACSSPTAATTR